MQVARRHWVRGRLAQRYAPRQGHVHKRQRHCVREILRARTRVDMAPLLRAAVTMQRYARHVLARCEKRRLREEERRLREDAEETLKHLELLAKRRSASVSSPRPRPRPRRRPAPARAAKSRRGGGNTRDKRTARAGVARRRRRPGAVVRAGGHGRPQAADGPRQGKVAAAPRPTPPRPRPHPTASIRSTSTARPLTMREMRFATGLSRV